MHNLRAPRRCGTRQHISLWKIIITSWFSILENLQVNKYNNFCWNIGPEKAHLYKQEKKNVHTRQQYLPCMVQLTSCFIYGQNQSKSTFNDMDYNHSQSNLTNQTYRLLQTTNSLTNLTHTNSRSQSPINLKQTLDTNNHKRDKHLNYSSKKPIPCSSKSLLFSLCGRTLKSKPPNSLQQCLFIRLQFYSSIDNEHTQLLLLLVKIFSSTPRKILFLHTKKTQLQYKFQIGMRQFPTHFIFFISQPDLYRIVTISSNLY